MKVICYTGLLLCLCFTVNAQETIDGLVGAERSFAAASKSTTTRNSFLQYLDSNSIVFGRGEAVNGIKRWTERAEDSSLLLWEPRFALLAASQDFGVTLGPSIHQVNRNADTPRYYGHFISIWHVTKSRTWKVLCDIGIAYDSAYQSKAAIQKIALKKGTGVAEKEKDGVVRLESQIFNQGLRNEGVAYSIWDKAVCIFSGHHPLSVQAKEQIPSSPASQFQPQGELFSPSNDIFVRYGKYTNDRHTGNYLHVWIFEKEQWKLAVLAHS